MIVNTNEDAKPPDHHSLDKVHNVIAVEAIISFFC